MNATSIIEESRVLLRIGLPVVISGVLNLSMQFVDTVMTGHAGPNELAAVASASALFHPIFCLGIGVMVALTPIVAQLEGADRIHQIGPNVRQGIWISMLLALLSMLLLPHLSNLLLWMDYESEVVSITDGYLEAIIWGLPAAYAFLAIRHSLDGLGITRPCMYLTLLGLGVNIIGNYTLIFGNFGFPRMGAVGAGWTTTIAHWVILIGALIYLQSSQRTGTIRFLSRFDWPIWSYWREILRIGIPSGLSFGAETFMFTVVALMMGKFGVTALAAHQISINVAGLTFMIPMGISAAITQRVGNAVGQQNWEEVRFRGWLGVGVCVGIMSLTASIFILFPESIIGLYTSDNAVTDLAISILWMAALFQLSDGLQVSSMSALRGLKDTRVPLLTNLFSYWPVGMGLAYLFGFVWEWGVISVWGGLIAGLSVAAVLHSLRFYLLSQVQIPESQYAQE
ncbi:MAG: MATE family efflux transporter [Deltaproteobacteria bacterium]